MSDIPAGPTREHYDEANPGYAAFRFYKNNDDWADSVRGNLRDWGFNTVGGWGDAALATADLPECRVLHWGSSLQVPWCDIFADAFQKQIEEFAERDIIPLKEEAKLLGWFTDNELQWYADTIFHFHLHGDPSSQTRHKLIKLLSDHYKGDFQALQFDFDPAQATMFTELGQRGAVHLKPGGDGFAMIDRFAFLVAEQYYRVVHDAIRKHDTQHLILGDRYMSYCPPVVAKAAGPYVDVISSNFDWPDWKTGQFPINYLRMLHEQSGKPVLITEWYVAAEENRSGNRNSGVSFTIVKTQDQRAATAARRLEVLMGEPYIVGAHWFRYADEPTHGRSSDGEDFNFGLVDIHNRPYEKLVDALGRANRQAADVHEASATRRVAENLPVGRCSAEIQFPESLEHFSSATSEDPSPLADLRLAWNQDQLYLGLVGFRFVDSQMFAGSKIPSSHHQRLSFKLGEDSFEIAFNPDAPSSGQKAELSMVEARHRHLGVRFTYLIKVPVKNLKSVPKLKVGSVIPVEITLYDPTGESTCWKTSLVLEDEIDHLAETVPVDALPR